MPEITAPAARDDAGGSAIGRRVLGAGLAGLAASLLPGLRGRAAAGTDTTDAPAETVPDQGSTPQEGEEDDSTPGTETVVPEGQTPDETDAPTTTEAATTTTAPPRRPTAADIELLGFAQQLEMAVVGVYDRALGGDALDDTARTVFSIIRESHQAYGQTAAALLGQDSPRGGPLDVPELSALGTLGGSQEDLAAEALGAETMALATHIELVGQVESTEGAELLASMAVIESRNCVVLSELSGKSGLDALEIAEGDAIQMAAG
jgi:hypothetical protein